MTTKIKKNNAKISQSSEAPIKRQFDLGASFLIWQEGTERYINVRGTGTIG